MSCAIVGLVTYFKTAHGMWWAAIEGSRTAADGYHGPTSNVQALSGLVAEAIRGVGFPAASKGDTVVAPGWDVECDVLTFTELPTGLDGGD